MATNEQHPDDPRPTTPLAKIDGSEAEVTAPFNPAEKIVTEADAAAMHAAGQTDPLPPAGYRREEELEKRDRGLQAAIAELERTTNMGRIDVNLDIGAIENEIARFSHKDPDTGQRDYLIAGRNNDRFVYCWVQCKHPIDNPTQEVDSARLNGWEVAHRTLDHGTRETIDGKLQVVHVGSNLEWNAALGAYNIGDVALMWMTRERYIALLLIEQERRKQKEALWAGIVPRTFTDANGRALSRVSTEFDDPHGYVGRLIGSRGGAVPVQRIETEAARAQAQQIATQQFDEQLRTGRVEGAEVG